MSRSSVLTSLTATAQHAGNVAFDRLFGIQTAGDVPNADLGFGPETGEPYVPSNWLNLIGLARMLRGLDIGSDDAFLDLGCGKGQVVILAALFPFGRVIGVDLSPRMISVARANLGSGRRRLRRSPVELVEADAAGYRIPADVNHCFLYNPFPRAVMAEVVRRLEESQAVRPRVMHVFYLNAADADLFEARGFREVRRIRRLRHLVRGGDAS